MAHSAALFVLFLPLAIAAAPRPAPTAPAPKAPAPAIVTVTKTDGSAVRGQLASSDPKALSIVPLVKGTPQGEPVELPWEQVKSVNNGLTRQRVIAQWKKEHPDDICDDCHGAGTTVCPTCKGTGRDAAAAKDCPTCHGALALACTAPRCDHGKVPCPAPCLKLTEGKWVMKPDGLRWRKIVGRRGYGVEVSENHLGQVVEMKDGVPQPPVPCPTCKGEQKIDCPTCHGTGTAPCRTCVAAAAKQPCTDCKGGQVACKTCTGTGLKSLAGAVPPDTPAPKPAAPAVPF